MKKLLLSGLLSLLLVLLWPVMAFASEANLKIPNLSQGQNIYCSAVFVVCILGMLFGLYQFTKVKKNSGPPIHAGCGEHHL